MIRPGVTLDRDNEIQQRTKLMTNVYGRTNIQERSIPRWRASSLSCRRTISEPSEGTGNSYRLTDGISGDSSRDVSPSARGTGFLFDTFIAVLDAVAVCDASPLLLAL